jgi:carbamoyltransferase
MRTNIDLLVLGHHLLVKADQPDWAEQDDWRKAIPFD